jgi:hypothetical protein
MDDSLLTTAHRITLIQDDRQIVFMFTITSRNKEDYHRQYNKLMQQYRHCRIVNSEFHFC